MKKIIRVLMTFLMVGTCSLAMTGKGSWYGSEEHGKLTASGEVYNMHAMTCASNSHKMHTILKVTNLKNGKSVTCRVNDTGGFKKYGRIIDLSKASFEQISDLKQGIINVKVEVIGHGKKSK